MYFLGLIFANVGRLLKIFLYFFDLFFSDRTLYFFFFVLNGLFQEIIIVLLVLFDLHVTVKFRAVLPTTVLFQSPSQGQRL